MGAQGTSCFKPRGSLGSSPLRPDGSRNDQAGEAGPVEQSSAEAKSLKPGSNEYGDDLTEFQDQHRRLLGRCGVAIGLNFEILDLTAVVGPVEPILGKRTTSSGASIWAEGDNVHLSREAYKDAANAIVEMATSCGNTVPRDSASSTETSDSLKRKQPESVVTFPAQPAKRRGGNETPGAGWMRGEADRGRACNAPSWRARARGWPYRPRSGNGPRRGWAGRGHRGCQRRPW
jgi:hypothetical protein